MVRALALGLPSGEHLVTELLVTERKIGLKYGLAKTEHLTKQTCLVYIKCKVVVVSL